ncbi:hypothetical protein HK102_006851 [Quaeritorhiza haematococci]|nr:hypothetical protein HK102_006851 [Quaeritorhiza haematococci]
MEIETRTPALTYDKTFPWLMGLAAIALLIGLGNTAWAIRHTISVARRWAHTEGQGQRWSNVFNGALCASNLLCCLYLACMVAGEVVFYKHVVGGRNEGPGYDKEAILRRQIDTAGRVFVSLASLIYLLLVLARFRLMKMLWPYSNYIDYFLSGFTIIIWIPSGIVYTVFMLWVPSPEKLSELQRFYELLQYIDKVWDTYFVIVDTVIGFTIMYHVINTKQLSPDIETRSSDSKLTHQSIDRRFYRNVIISLVFWILVSWTTMALYWVNTRLYGSDLETAINTFHLIWNVSAITYTLQFTGACLYMSQLKYMMSSIVAKAVSRQGYESEGEKTLERSSF